LFLKNKPLDGYIFKYFQAYYYGNLITWGSYIMLNGINQNTSSEILTGSSAVERLQNGLATNPYQNDRNFLIDETNISSTAINLWEKELDAKRFTHLVTSNPEDDWAERLVQENVLKGKFSIDDTEDLYNLLSNDNFLKDVMM
jgi:hypothetical protein